MDRDLGSSLGRLFSLGFSPGFSVKLSAGVVGMGRCDEATEATPEMVLSMAGSWL